MPVVKDEKNLMMAGGGQDDTYEVAVVVDRGRKSRVYPNGWRGG